MGIREEIERFKAPVEATLPTLGKIRFRRLKVGEALTLSTLESMQYLCAVIAATAQDEGGKNLFASKEEVAELPTCVFNPIKRAYLELNPVGLDEAAKKLTPPESSP